jgi:bifunctional non-homologous end joining protein LigD
VRLFTRKAATLPSEATAALPVRPCVVDGEAIACDQNGLAVFEMIPRRPYDHAVNLCAFDLLELSGKGLRQAPIEDRKRALAQQCAVRIRV